MHTPHGAQRGPLAATGASCYEATVLPTTPMYCSEGHQTFQVSRKFIGLHLTRCWGGWEGGVSGWCVGCGCAEVYVLAFVQGGGLRRGLHYLLNMDFTPDK